MRLTKAVSSLRPFYELPGCSTSPSSSPSNQPPFGSGIQIFKDYFVKYAIVDLVGLIDHVLGICRLSIHVASALVATVDERAML